MEEGIPLLQFKNSHLETNKLPIKVEMVNFWWGFNNKFFIADCMKQRLVPCFASSVGNQRHLTLGEMCVLDWVN